MQGQSTEHCGTPGVTWTSEEASPSNTTLWVLSVKNALIQQFVLPCKGKKVSSYKAQYSILRIAQNALQFLPWMP